MSLDAILEAMQDACAAGDTEIAHCDADALLLRTLRLFAHADPLVAQIIDAYEDVDKWYA